MFASPLRLALPFRPALCLALAPHGFLVQASVLTIVKLVLHHWPHFCSLPSCSLAKPSFEDTWAYQAISCLLARRPSQIKQLPSGRTLPPGSHAVQLLGRPAQHSLGPSALAGGPHGHFPFLSAVGPRPALNH